MSARIDLSQLKRFELDDDTRLLIETETQRISGLAEPADQWRELATRLAQHVPFEVCRWLHNCVFAEPRAESTLAPIFVPGADELQRSNIGRLLQQLELESPAQLQRWSVENKVEFWSTMIARLSVVFERPFDRLVELPDHGESPQWLVGGRLNIAASCFQAEPDSVAIVTGTENGELHRWTVGQLRQRAEQVARAIQQAGIQPGEAVAIAMPMTAESVAAYLGIVLAGAVVVGIADSFAAPEIRTRLRIANARMVITQDVVPRAGRVLPLYDKIVTAEAERVVVIPAGEQVQTELRSGDYEWSEFLDAVPGEAEFQPVTSAADSATNVLFSSGTTGEPKAIPWTHTTPIKCAVDAWLHHDIQPRDVLCWPTSLGWMMGPWLLYAALMNRATIALYTDAPTTRGFGRFVQQAGVTMLGVVPSLVRAWRATACMEGLDWSRMRAFSSTGECSSPEDMHYLSWLAGYRPIVEYCGGTEIGGGYICGNTVEPTIPSTFCSPAFGLDLQLVDADGQPATVGEVQIHGPSIGLSTRLINRDHYEVYYEGMPVAADGQRLRRHGDELERLANGYYRAHGRTDDTMNLGGIKVSSAQIERVLNRLPGVTETAAVAISPPSGGPSQLVVFAVLESSDEVAPVDLQRQMQSVIRSDLNPLFKVHRVQPIASLPRTASNKVMRRELRSMYVE